MSRKPPASDPGDVSVLSSSAGLASAGQGAVETVHGAGEQPQSQRPPPQLPCGGRGAGQPGGQAEQGEPVRAHERSVEEPGQPGQGSIQDSAGRCVKHGFGPRRGVTRTARVEPSRPPGPADDENDQGGAGGGQAPRVGSVGPQRGVGEAAGNHPEGAAQHEVAEPDRREPGGVVDGDEGHERDQANDEDRGQAVVSQQRVDARQAAADETVDRVTPEQPPETEGDDRADQGRGQGESGSGPQTEQCSAGGREQCLGAGDQGQADVEREEQGGSPRARCVDARPHRLDVGGPEHQGETDGTEHDQDQRACLEGGSSTHASS